MRAELTPAPTGATFALAATTVCGAALTESSFAGSTTIAPMVIAVIATAINPNVARGIAGS